MTLIMPFIRLIKYFLLCAGVALLLIPPPVQATEPISVVKSPSSGAQYERSDWVLNVAVPVANPFLQEEITLDLVATSPSGKRVVLPCFYEATSPVQAAWNARFTPRESGEYQIRFRLTLKGVVTSTTKSVAFNVSPTMKRGFLNPQSDWTFRFDNGEYYRGIGINLCWESRSNDDSKYFKALHENPRFNYNHLFGLLNRNGGSFTRIWMCPWNLPLEARIVSPNTSRYRNSDDYFNPDAIRRMDEVITLADSLGIFIMLALDQAGNYLGGQWEVNNYNSKNGGPAADAKDFFLNPAARQQYKNRLRYLIARWGYSPSIAMWEFFNEVDYLSFDKDTTDHSRRLAVVDWHTDMSRWLKANDPYQHLVTTSISHMDVKGLNSIPDIDINQKHVYKYTSGIPQIIRDYSDRYGKPYVIGEFGYEWDWSKNFDDFGSNMDSDFKRGLWLGLFSPTPVLPMSWWWEYFENRGMFGTFQSVRLIHDQMMAAGQGTFSSIPVTAPSDDVQALAVRCGKTTFVYVYKSSGSDHPVELKLKEHTGKPARGKLVVCDTRAEDGFSGFSQGSDGLNLTLPAMKAGTDVVLILD